MLTSRQALIPLKKKNDNNSMKNLMFLAGEVRTRRRGMRGLFEFESILDKPVNYSYYIIVISFAVLTAR